MKIKFDINSKCAGTWTGCKYEHPETTSLAIITKQAELWAKQATHMDAVIENVEILNDVKPELKAYMNKHSDKLENEELHVGTDDEFNTWVAEHTACDPEYQGETGLMRAYEAYSEECELEHLYGDVYAWIN